MQNDNSHYKRRPTQAERYRTEAHIRAMCAKVGIDYRSLYVVTPLLSARHNQQKGGDTTER